MIPSTSHEPQPFPPSRTMGIADTSNQDQHRTNRQRHWRTPLLMIGTVLTLTVVIAGLWRSSLSQANLVISKQQVQLAKVSRGDFVRDVAAQGKIVAANAPSLYSLQAGQVSLFKQPGEAVAQGDVIAKIDSPTLFNQWQQQQSVLDSMRSDFERSQLQAREAKLDMEQVQNSAQVNLLAARRELQRAEQSLAAGVLRRIDFDIAQDRLTQAELEFDHAKRKVALAADKLSFEKQSGQAALDRQGLVVADLQQKLDSLTITSPVTGQVGSWLVQQQAQVNAGQALLSVVDLSQYEAELSVSESYARELSAGLAVDIELNGKHYAGELSHVAPEVTANQVLARVRFTELPEQLRQNQRVSARVILEQRQNVLRVNRGDFISSGGGRHGYKVQNDVAEQVPLQLGALSVQYVEIVSGASEGDTLVVSNLYEFKNAQRVRLN